MRLAGKRALITGGGNGSGRVTAELFGREGTQVMVSGRRQAELEETVRLIQKAGGEASLVQGDVARLEDAERMVGETVRQLRGVDIVVNNAGINVRNASVTAVSIEDWERVIGIDLTGVFLVSRFALEEMIKQGEGGTIVNVSSVAGMVTDANTPPYAAAKGGLNMLTRSMAYDYAPYGIRVNAVCPGRIVTPMMLSRFKSDEDPKETLAQWGRKIPLGRLV